jgi:hypothetical protein
VRDGAQRLERLLGAPASLPHSARLVEGLYVDLRPAAGRRSRNRALGAAAIVVCLPRARVSRISLGMLLEAEQISKSS